MGPTPMASAPQRVTIRIPAWPTQPRERNLLGLKHEADPNHLISSGGLSYLNEQGWSIDWKSFFSLPHSNRNKGLRLMLVERLVDREEQFI